MVSSGTFRIVLRDVSVSYNHSNPCHWGLRKVSLEFCAGERILILGLNGSGKSTLLNAIACLVDYSGEIRVDGASVGSDWKSTCDSLVSFVPQNITEAIGTCVTVGELLRLFPRSSIGSELGESTLRFILEIKDKLLSELSGGQRQYLISSLALSQRARILLFDEVFRSLDVTVASLYLDMIKRAVSKESSISLFVSHDPEFMRPLATRVVALRGGSIIFDAPMDDDHLRAACVAAYDSS